MKDIYLATGNNKKAKELQTMLMKSGLDFIVHTAEAIGGMPAVKETETTFEGNARLKAQALFRAAPEGSWVLGDDSGLCVDALKGAPGLYSARYAGENATDEENYTKLLKELSGVGDGDRSARFQCCFVLIHQSIGEMVFLGSVKGVITKEPLGDNGFGYDPVFIPNGFRETCAELRPEVKDEIAHRGLAMREMIEWLRTR